MENFMLKNTQLGHLGLLTCILVCLFSCGKEHQVDYMALIEQGEFTQAEKVIKKILTCNDSLSAMDRGQLSFEIERMQRIRKDFTKTEQEVIEYIRKYIPDVTKEEFTRWENEKALEYMIIDGQKHYFNRAARNLFRIDKNCRKIWADFHRNQEIAEEFGLDKHINEVITAHRETKKKYLEPVRLQFDYAINVKPNTVPKGELIGCWIPFPREISGRQTDIRLLNSDPAEYLISDERYLQRTIYLEKASQGEEETVFSVKYEYTSHAVYVDINAEQVGHSDPSGELKPFLQEEAPHIVFTPELKELSRNILQGEENPYRKAQLLFAWIDENIPWASAREYSTIRNLSSYCYENMHGDCGIKALLQITLCRLNGIPARWQSGWRFKPPGNLMHDWAMVYFEPYGWLPMDVDYGMRESDNEQIRFFYLGGMDSYRLIFNDAYSQAFYPAKEYFRSETIDSQRGELEWSGGNLYFDQWQWKVSYKVLPD
jgi:hypothetical protein